MNIDPKHPLSHAKRFIFTAGLWALCLVASLVLAQFLSTLLGMEFNPSIVVLVSFALSVTVLVLHARKRAE